MTLEFEQITADVAKMVQRASQMQRQQEAQLDAVLRRLNDHADDWEAIDVALERALAKADPKFFRAARPLRRHTPLNQGRTPGPCPPRATIVAGDGSQIVPDRHAPFLYYLTNVGVIIYHHGSGEPPEIFTRPNLDYPGSEARAEEDSFEVSSALVSLRRDRAEIETLADTAWERRDAARPFLAISDQRLLYWPVGSFPGKESQRVVEAWQDAMTKIRDSGGWLAGYIDRPGKRSVLNMLRTLDIDAPDFDITRLNHAPSDGLTDTDLYSKVLQPGERSPVFVDISQHNSAFREREPLNEICFFYLKTGGDVGQLARVDIPMWVAQDAAAVTAVHALLYDQCQILGQYPYVITRADEIAVVSHREQEELENRIALGLQSQGIDVYTTAKQLHKGYTRSGRMRFGK